MHVLTSLTVNPKEPAGELRAEAEERAAQVRALAGLMESTADEHGFLRDVDKHALGALRVLTDQAVQLLAKADELERRPAPPVNGSRRRVEAIETGEAQAA